MNDDNFNGCGITVPTGMSYLGAVEINWSESSIPCTGDKWCDISDIPKIIDDIKNSSQYHHTVGIYIGESDEYVYVAKHISDVNNTERQIKVKDVTAINKKDINSIQALCAL